jgi:hypothetical protein
MVSFFPTGLDLKRHEQQNEIGKVKSSPYSSSFPLQSRRGEANNRRT